MKHYRDLVLSTKEPQFHNVLWIKPLEGLNEYTIYMYEGSGWIPLYGNSFKSLNYDKLKLLPDGYVIQLFEDAGIKKTNLYPKTLASLVFTAAGIDVESLINRINLRLDLITSNIKKVYIVKESDLTSVDKLNKLICVGEENIITKNIRKYILPNNFNIVDVLLIGDLVAILDINNNTCKGIAYVKDVTENTDLAIISQYATKEYVNELDENYWLDTISEIYVDGVQVSGHTDNCGNETIYKTAHLHEPVKKVYFLNDDKINELEGTDEIIGMSILHVDDDGFTFANKIITYITTTEYIEYDLKLYDILIECDNKFNPHNYSRVYIVTELLLNSCTLLKLADLTLVDNRINAALSTIENKTIVLQGSMTEDHHTITVNKTANEIAALMQNGYTLYIQTSLFYGLIYSYMKPAGANVPTYVVYMKSGYSNKDYSCEGNSIHFQLN